MKVQMVGCSHHHSSVALRERLAFGPAQVGPALDGLRERFPRSEAVLLSTCNRVEIYTASEDPAAAPSHEQVVQFMADFHGLPIYEIGLYLTIAAAALTLWSMISYMRAAWPVLTAPE